MKELHCLKAKGYGKDRDPLANLRASEDFGIPAYKGTIIRMNDKVSRIKSHLTKSDVPFESLEDDLKDLAAYALLAVTLLREA